MAGRGRGGKTGTLTQEQLQALGCVGKDIPQVSNVPPPTFPLLLNKPVSIKTTAAQSYQILWKEDFLNHMRDSPYYTTQVEQKLHKGSDWSEKGFESKKLKAEPEFNYALMPAELQLNNRKRRMATAKPNLLNNKKSNIDDTLKELEEKEKTEAGKDNADRNKNNSDSEHEDEEQQDETAMDDEMDDENDYGNSYFDNGEAYNEEDDNLDDGPVY